MQQNQLAQVYEMVDNISFSRPKKNIGRDFSDGLMMAQLVHHYYPKRVQIHNYPSTNTVTKKIQNWNTLNNKVLKKLGINLSSKQIQDIVNVKSMSIQKILYRFLIKFERPQQQKRISNRLSNGYDQQSYIQNSNIMNKNTNQMSFMNKKGQMVNVKRQKQDTQQILDLIDKIDYAYAQLIKLQQMNRLKDDMVKNLQKKVQKVIFN